MARKTSNSAISCPTDQEANDRKTSKNHTHRRQSKGKSCLQRAKKWQIKKVSFVGSRHCERIRTSSRATSHRELGRSQELLWFALFGLLLSKRFLIFSKPRLTYHCSSHREFGQSQGLLWSTPWRSHPRFGHLISGESYMGQLTTQGLLIGCLEFLIVYVC